MPPAGHDAVQVRMQGEVLTQGAAHGDHPRALQVGGIAGEGTDHAQAVENRAHHRPDPPQAQPVQLPNRVNTTWKWHRQRSSAFAGRPPSSSRASTWHLGTMTVPGNHSYAQVGNRQGNRSAFAQAAVRQSGSGAGCALPVVVACSAQPVPMFAVRTCATSQAGLTVRERRVYPAD